jgi:integrase
VVLADAHFLRRGVIVTQRIKTGSCAQDIDSTSGVVLREDVIPELQRMLGHKSAKVTLDTYADLFDDDLDAVGVTLDSRYSPEVVAKVWPQGVDRHPQQT